jgi:hypothetical protein
MREDKASEAKLLLEAQVPTAAFKARARSTAAASIRSRPAVSASVRS